jgi:hypothetical protein
MVRSLLQLPSPAIGQSHRVRRRNPTGVVRAAIFVVSWIWLVFVEMFMAH